jgi:histone H4
MNIETEQIKKTNGKVGETKKTGKKIETKTGKLGKAGLETKTGKLGKAGLETKTGKLGKAGLETKTGKLGKAGLETKKGSGKAGMKRHRKVLRDNIQGITKPAIRRLARRAGVKRVSGLVYEETRNVLKVFLENIVKDAIAYTEHSRRKTVTAMDVVHALKRQGRTLYGFGY